MKSDRYSLLPKADANQEDAHLPEPYQKFVEHLAKIKGRGKLNDRHLWVIIILLVICTLIYYAEQILSIANVSLEMEFFLSVHDLHRTLFLIPLFYSAITYRLRGSLWCSLVILAVILPRAFIFSSFPDPIARSLIFFCFSSFISIFISIQWNYIEYQVETRGNLQKLTEEVATLHENKENLVRFFNMAAHDMKTPLAAVQNYMNTMLAGFCGELNEKQKHWLGRSKIRIEELTDLINDLLDIALIEKGSIFRDMKMFSLAEEIKRCVNELSPLASAKALKLVAETDGDLNVYGSDTSIRRVLMNLISNAINYTPDKGEITVRAMNKDRSVLVEVIDSGIGIPEDELSKVFQDFYRASNVKGIKGTGLGLSIVKSILDIHGSTVRVESPVPGSDKGCRFSFSLPVRDATE